VDTKVEVIFSSGKKVDAVLGDFMIKTDQSVAHGGEGSAPSPLQLFVASIATCAGFFAREFCVKRTLSTEGLALVVTCDVDVETKRYTKMTLEMTLPTGFPEKYTDAIIRAVDLCAVKKHILNPPFFEIKAIPHV
jgi:putative redox protein